MKDINKIKIRLNQLINKRSNKEVAYPWRVIKEDELYYLILKDTKQPEILLSTNSSDGYDFITSDKLPNDLDLIKKYPSGSVIYDPIKKERIIYYGNRQIFFTKISKNWVNGNSKFPIISPRPLEVGGAFLFSHGILLLYYEKYILNNITYYKAYLAEFDKENPEKLLWKTEEPVWSSRDHWKSKQIVSLGAVKNNNTIIMYWSIAKNIVFAVSLAGFLYDPNTIKSNLIKLKKHNRNPILAPRTKNKWEAFTTLNPAAAYIKDRVHILYRAQGHDYISSVGYATTSDGLTIDHRLDYPIYTPKADFETNRTGTVDTNLWSAGGYGGCEDPRITVVGNKLYMVYVAFNGWSNLRLALTSITLKDFLNQRWNWQKPILISPPGVIDKSGCLLPEKINGQYVFFHRVFPNILIDYVDSLNFKGKNKWLKGKYQIKIRPSKWDSRKIGVGAPPLKTKEGWLVIYYGVDDKDASKYHIGAMLLDLKNPTRVLHRPDEPILSPTETYENTGFKPGIAYPCGAVIIKDELLVYYGAADSFVCVAKAKLSKFLKDLIANKPPHFEKIKIKEIIY